MESELKNCQLCAWKCSVNRLDGERGVCGQSMPEIAYTNLAQVLQSYSVTMLGCSFKCIYCNAYRLSQYPDSRWYYRGYVDPSELASEAIYQIDSEEGKAMGVDKIASIEPSVPLRIIPFRPNYILYYHPGPTKRRMDEIGADVLKTGLEDVWWGGYYPVDISERVNEIARGLKGNKGARIAFAYSKLAGCIKETRNCGECTMKLNCPAGLKEPWLLDV